MPGPPPEHAVVVVTTMIRRFRLPFGGRPMQALHQARAVV